MVASARACNTMQVWVRSDAEVHACVPECYARSGRSDGQIVSGWQGQSGVHDRSKAQASRGI
jgi:hypothetical protein